MRRTRSRRSRATTYICTHKTGTLTRNEMSVIEVRTLRGLVTVSGEGYRPEGNLTGAAAAITADVVHGHPSNVLVAASKEADLLVVGNRGHSTVTGMLLGSVSQPCVHHTECPVMVVRGAS